MDFTLTSNYFSKLADLEAACVMLAIDLHNSVNQKYDGKPYGVHLQAVNKEIITYISFVPLHYQTIVKCTGWLHDVFEDTHTTYNDLKKHITSLCLELKINKKEAEFIAHNICELVYACTNLRGRTRAQRANWQYYLGIRWRYLATFIKLADRLANVNYSFVNGGKNGMYKKYCAENKSFLKKVQPRFLSKIYFWMKGYEAINYKPMLKQLKEICADGYYVMMA